MPAPRIFRTLAAVGVVAVIGSLAACAGPSDSPEAGPSADTTPTYVTDGKLTIATGQPAYEPYVVDDTPENGQGFESAIAYAVAEELGFGADDVVWVRTGFDEAIQPGPKTFDFNLQQFSITPEREETVDFSTPYYSTPQAIITVAGSNGEGATSIADLKDLVIGAQTGTTSFTTAESAIAPTGGVQAFNTNDDAKLALQNGSIDALIVDLPTAFYLTAAELDGGIIVGQLPATDGISDEWGLLLDKDSTLTDSVTEAVNALRDDGSLAEIADQWLGGEAGAPVLE